MTAATTPLRAAFGDFCARLDDPELRDEVAARAEVTAAWLTERVEISRAEARHTIGFLDRELEPGRRLLEVGAGLGITSAFLSSQGYDVTSIEPGGEGFEDYRRTNPALRAALGVAHPHYEIEVEDVTVDALGGPFDLIFSNNVLEHVVDPDLALERLDAVLAPGGAMVHNCPNYSAPYEPHFGVPLVPIRPALTAKVLPRRISESGVWRSLNFVTARQVRGVASRLGREVEFRPGMMADALGRLDDDDFAARHPALARCSRPLGAVARLLGRLPASLATPMVFRWSRSSAAA